MTGQGFVPCAVTGDFGTGGAEVAGRAVLSTSAPAVLKLPGGPRPDFGTGGAKVIPKFKILERIRI